MWAGFLPALLLLQSPRLSSGAIGKVIGGRKAASDFPVTILRLPAIQGPSDPLAWEWFCVWRVFDCRRRIVLPDGGLGLFFLLYF
jgi:hypothetical protein